MLIIMRALMPAARLKVCPPYLLSAPLSQKLDMHYKYPLWRYLQRKVGANMQS